MLTPETIRRHFRGPYRKGNELKWRWHQKGRRWPRISFVLTYSPASRTFYMSRFRKMSVRADSVRDEFTPDKVTLDGFRACLTAEDIACCIGASLTAPRRWP